MKIGVIGLGFMGATHLRAFSAIQNVKVAAVSATNPEALTGDLTRVGGNIGNAAGRYDFREMSKYQDWRDLVRDPSLDAVDICLPTDLHLPVALEAFANGKHVLCEKPMAASIEACNQMQAAAARAGKILMVGQVLRFWPEYLFLRDFVQSGKYGRIRTATFVRRSSVPDWSKWLLDLPRSGGALLDLLVHDIDQALLLFGMPSKVAAKSLGDVDTIAATLIYPGGPEVRIQGGWFPSGTPFAMGFQVLADNAQLDLTPGGLQLGAGTEPPKPVTPPGADGYQAELSYFVDCCVTGQQPLRCLPEDSANAVKVALALKESRSLEGKQISCVF